VWAKDPSLSPGAAYQQTISSPAGMVLRGLARVQDGAIGDAEARPEPETPAQRSARSELNRLVDQIQLQNPRMSASDAWTEAHRRDPGLYRKAKGLGE